MSSSLNPETESNPCHQEIQCVGVHEKSRSPSSHPVLTLPPLPERLRNYINSENDTSDINAIAIKRFNDEIIRSEVECGETGMNLNVTLDDDVEKIEEDGSSSSGGAEWDDLKKRKIEEDDDNVYVYRDTKRKKKAPQSKKVKFDPKHFEKDKLMNIASALDVDIQGDLLAHLPRKGFSAEKLSDLKCRSFRNARAMYRKMITALNEVFCPENPSLCMSLSPMSRDGIYMKDLKDFDALGRNTLELYLSGNKETSTIAGSIIARTFRQSDVNDKISYFADKTSSSEPLSCNINEPRYKVGRKKHGRLKSTFDILVQGNPIPQQEYHFRVPSATFSTCIDYVHGKCKAKPGTRDIKVRDYVFPNLPIYDLGGLSLTTLFSDYKKSITGGKDTLGRTTFFQLVKALTKKGDNPKLLCKKTKENEKPTASILDEELTQELPLELLDANVSSIVSVVPDVQEVVKDVIHHDTVTADHIKDAKTLDC